MNDLETGIAVGMLLAPKKTISKNKLLAVASGDFSKVIVTIPIDETYHYTINVFFADGVNFIPHNSYGGNSTDVIPNYYNEVDGSGKQYDIMKIKCANKSVEYWAVCWKDGKPLFAQYLNFMCNYHNTFGVASIYPQDGSPEYRNYMYRTNEYRILWETISGGGGGITFVKTTGYYRDRITVASISCGGAVEHKGWTYTPNEDSHYPGTVALTTNETVSISTSPLTNTTIYTGMQTLSGYMYLVSAEIDIETELNSLRSAIVNHLGLNEGQGAWLN